MAYGLVQLLGRFIPGRSPGLNMEGALPKGPAVLSRRKEKPLPRNTRDSTDRPGENVEKVIGAGGSGHTFRNCRRFFFFTVCNVVGVGRWHRANIRHAHALSCSPPWRTCGGEQNKLSVTATSISTLIDLRMSRS
jgi:hypothetical protein